VGFYVEPCNAGEDLRGAHVQSINQDARGSPIAMNLRKLWRWICRLGSLRASGCRWCYRAMKALPDAMKPREEGLVKTNPDETRPLTT